MKAGTAYSSRLSSEGRARIAEACRRHEECRDFSTSQSAAHNQQQSIRQFLRRVQLFRTSNSQSRNHEVLAITEKGRAYTRIYRFAVRRSGHRWRAAIPALTRGRSPRPLLLAKSIAGCRCSMRKSGDMKVRAVEALRSKKACI